MQGRSTAMVTACRRSWSNAQRKAQWRATAGVPMSALSLALDPELLHPGLERRGLDPEDGPRPTSPLTRQPVPSSTSRMCAALDFLQGRDAAGSWTRLGAEASSAAVSSGPPAENHGALDDVLQLAHVPGPGVGDQRRSIIRSGIGGCACRACRRTSGTKCWTRSGMSSRRSRSGGRWIGNTLSR